MRQWSAERVAAAAGARLVSAPADEPSATASAARLSAAAPASGPVAPGPLRATVDSRDVRPGDLFVGLRGQHRDGGAFATAALAAGAWGVLVAPEHVEAAASAGAGGAVLAAEDPLAALQRLAAQWRRALGAATIGVTGSTGKTSTKDILAAMLAPHRATFASPANFNTEIGLPLAVLAAPPETEALVLEMAMRGESQIAALTAIAQPDVGVIVNVGPVHLELLGTLEAVAAAKAELLRDMPAGGTAVVPAGEALLEPHLRDDLEVVRFGDGGDVRLAEADGPRLAIDARGERIELEVSFTQAHNRLNALAAVAAARAIGVVPSGRVDVPFSALRGERLDLPGAVAVVNDCYNANPMSMRAALDDLAATASGRRVAILGDMLELGEREREFHSEVGRHAAEHGVELLIAVGSLAADMLDEFDGEAYAVADAGEAASLAAELVAPGDTVLVKGSRGVGLEIVAPALAEVAGARG